MTYPSRHQKYAQPSLSRGEISEAADAGLEWAIELRNDLNSVDRWLRNIDSWSFPHKEYWEKDKHPHCPICYRAIKMHDLNGLVLCFKSWAEREDCDHDWQDDFVGGSICSKCKWVQ